MRQELAGGYELDDRPGRVDRDVVHGFLASSYWASERGRSSGDRLIDEAALVVGVYRGTEQVGHCRVVSDRHTVAYLADVFVLEQHRGRGLAGALVRFALDHPTLAGVRTWLLHTREAHALYRKAGFAEPGARLLERRRGR